jgi:hypothetical protein
VHGPDRHLAADKLKLAIGDLSLMIVTDDDLGELVDLALEGVHEPEFMPFAVPWTDAGPAELPAKFVRHHWASRAQSTPEAFTLSFTVRRENELGGNPPWLENDDEGRCTVAGSHRIRALSVGGTAQGSVCTAPADGTAASACSSP